MRRSKRLLLCIIMMLCVVVGNEVTVFAQENLLAEYEAELNVLNRQLGRNYKLSPTEGSTYEDMVEFYCEMTIEEFDQYIYNAYEAELLFDERMAGGSGQISTTSLDYTFLEIQKYFYDGNINYLYLRANVSDKDGVAYYDSAYSMGSTMSSYPAYGCEDGSVNFSADRREAYCTWVCTKHLSKDLIATGLYTLNCTFIAEGGNVQGGIIICTPPSTERER